MVDPAQDARSMERLLSIMTRLRDPESGCPWDIEQTFQSIVPHTIEEAYEVADAVEHGNTGHLMEELGDLLLQVVFYAQMAQEDGGFDFHDVVQAVSDKLVRRHPHVFGDREVADAEAQIEHWENLKEAERGEKAAESVLDDVAGALPALTRAGKLQKRAARVGFDWPDVGGPLAKIREETEEVRLSLAANDNEDHSPELDRELGDLLFSVVNLARKTDIDPESALRHANERFEHRFRQVERGLADAGRDLKAASLEEMDGLWQAAKEREKEDRS